MNIFKAYALGVKNASSAPRMLGLIYLINLLTASLLAVPFYGVMKTTAGNSLALKELLSNFDATVFLDLLHQLKEVLVLMRTGLFWLIFVYLIITVFLTGGILKSLNKSMFTMSTFFGGAGYNFFRFLGSSLLMWLLYAVLFVVSGLVIGAGANSLQAHFATDREVGYFVIGTLIVSSLIFSLLVIISDYTKFYMLLNDTGNFLKAFFKATGFVFRHFFSTYTLFWMLQILPVLLLYLYIKLEGDTGMSSGTAIVIVFVMQQVYMLIRVWLRVWTFAGQFEFFSAYFIKDDKINQQRKRIHEWDMKLDTAKEVLQKKEDEQRSHTTSSSNQTANASLETSPPPTTEAKKPPVEDKKTPNTNISEEDF